MSKFKKTLIIIGSILIAVIIIVILIISPLTKYLVEKYDVKYTGREITLDWAYVNPFTGFVQLNNLVIYEQNSQIVFLSADVLSADLTLIKLFVKTYEISEITLVKPRGFAIRNLKDFNFSDIIETFSSDKKKEKKKNPVRFSMLNISIVDGEFHYKEKDTPVNYYIKNTNITSEGLQYDNDIFPIHFSFLSGIGSGKVKGDLSINMDNLNYNLGIKVDTLNLEIINQYLKDMTNYGTFAAILDADMNSKGNFRSADSISTKGHFSISNFHFGKSKNDDFASFEKLAISIAKLSLKDMIYHYDSVSLNKLYFKYERYDSLDNVQTIFGVKGNNVTAINANSNKFNLVIEIAQLIERISRNFLRSQYKVGRFALYDSDIQYSDFSLNEYFNIGLYPFSVFADSIDKKNARVDVSVQSGIKPYGDLEVSLSVNPQDSSDFDVNYRIKRLPLTLFNPYLTAYTSYPLNRGSLNFRGNWKVRNGMINSENRLVLVDPRFANRIKNDENKWIPVPIAMALIRERGNVIDYEIPIKGNLKDPDFKLRDVFFDLLKNIITKPLTAPYGIKVKILEKEMEKTLTLNWEKHNDDLTRNQEQVLEKIAKFLKENEDSKITIQPFNYVQKDREHILMFEAKKKYYLFKNKMKEKLFSSKDSIAVARMSIKDVGFEKYLNQKVEHNNLFTAQHKAEKLFDEKFIDNKNNELIALRKKKFLSFFTDKKINKKINFGSIQNVIPFNGFTFYEITYNGIFPDYLLTAFEEMDELDNENPRKKYKRVRNSIKRKNEEIKDKK